MRIRFFNAYEPASTFYRELVPYLSVKGFVSDIVISKSEYRLGRNLEQALQSVPGVKITRTTGLGFQAVKNNLSKAVAGILYILHGSLYALLGPGVKLNVFLTQPPLFYLLGYLLSIVRRQPYCCVVMDVFPQEMVEFGLLKRDSLLTRLLARLSAFALRQATAVIVIGRCMAECIAAMGVDRSRIHFIPNWVDERIIRPIEPDQNPMRRDLGWQDKYVVFYGGNIGNAQYFDDLLLVAEQTKDYTDLLFAIVGQGSRQKEIKARVEERKLTNVVLLPFPHDKYPLSDILSAGDLHFISLKNACTGLAVPSKTYGTLAVGRPIVYQGSAQGEIARMISEQDIGVVVPSGDVDGLRNSILKYYNDRETLKWQGQRAHELAESTYSHGRALDQYVTLFKDQVRNGHDKR